jgi:hypothetical protein
MKRSLSVAAMAVLALALPAFARVLSYAPYTNTPAAPGLHSRTSRYFALLEGSNEYARQVVLYDSSEREEPRVVYPPASASSSTTPLEFVALYEREGDERPMLLVGTWYYGIQFSPDGGNTWKRITGPFRIHLKRDSWIDYGGAQTQPLWHPVQTGNDRHPFFVHHHETLYAIDTNGIAKVVAPAHRLIGSDRERNRFLVRRGDAVEMVDVWGNRKKLFDRQPASAYEGWITPSGQAYIVRHVNGQRFLYHYRNRNLYFVGGPYDTPPPLNEPGWEDDALRFFAVPTHDYDGAWMIQRQAGRPTTLSRHTSGGDVEVMWSDPTGREVEALIPGRSGETLLIQVHVPRATTTSMFVDPALAVWRVGEPMPVAYDELYVHEEANKGFLHVDVDRLQDGEMFVFNSGLTFGEEPQSGPISAPIEGGADVFQEWGVVRASLKQRLVLPGVTRTSGANGSQWQTDVTIYNPLDVPQQVEVRYAGVGLQPAVLSDARLTRTLTLAPNELRYVRDVLNALFLVAASGGSLFFTPEVGVTVFGRTYTTRDDGGTYGYGLHAIDFFNAAGPRFPLTYSGAFPGPGFRTNVMLTDTSGRGTAATLFGTSVATFAGAAAQSTAPATAGGPLTIQATRGTLIPMVVAIDNVTNDATYFPPDTAAPEERVIPLVASDGTWKSDLTLHNPSIYNRGMRLLAISTSGIGRIERRLYLGSGETLVLRDVLKTFFGMTGRAKVYYVSDDETKGEGIRVTSRLYATDAKSGGTYGTLMPPLNGFQEARTGDTLAITGISGGKAYQTNLVVTGLANAASILDVRIFGDGGVLLGSSRMTLAAHQQITIEDVLAKHGITAALAVRIEIEAVDAVRIGAFAMLIDRITKDPTFIPANLAAK